MESDCFQNKLHTLDYARFYSLQTNYSKISQMPRYPAVAAAVAPAIDWRVRRLKRQHVAVTERERKSMAGPCRLCACTYATALLFGWLSVSSAT